MERRRGVEGHTLNPSCAGSNASGGDVSLGSPVRDMVRAGIKSGRRRSFKEKP